MHPCSFWTAGLDYVSVVIMDETERPHIMSLIERHSEDEAQLGNLPRDFSAHGYNGFRVGGFQVAHLGHKLWVSLIGGTADIHGWTWLALAHHATRIDLALTATFEPPLLNLAQEEFKRYFALGSGSCRRKGSYICGTDGGQTLYLGSRKSPMYGRLYDRAAKAKVGELGSCWRWEVEYKAARADQLRQRLLAVEDDTTIKAGLVQEWFSQAGVSVPEVVTGETLQPLRSERQGNLWNTLAWLQQQVRPSVGRLVAAGYRNRCLEVLGLAPEE